MTHAMHRTTSEAAAVRAWLAQAPRAVDHRTTRWFGRIGERRVEFSSTDPVIADIAARRLWGDSDDGVEPDLRLGLLETEAMGWAPPRPCASEGVSLAVTRELAADGITAVMPVRQHGDGAFPWVVFDGRVGLIVVRSAADLPPWMVNAPFSLLIHLAVAARGLRLLHAASLGTDGRGVLIVGPGGAGKSATTISGLLAGLCTVGDDYVVADLGGRPRAWPVYGTLKQAPDGLLRYPALRKRTAGLPLNWHGKLEFDAELIRKGCIAEVMAIRAILIPRQQDQAKCSVEPAPATAAFSALAPSTLSQLPGAGLAGFSEMTRLTRAVPAYWLNLARNADEVGSALAAFVATLT